jgi:hypothetical protein
MVKYFKFKKINADGNRALYLKEKKDIFDKKPTETYISKKGSLIIYGIEASGKSQRLKTIVSYADNLWQKETKIIFKATDSLSEILHKNLDSDEETQKLLITNPQEIECIEDMIDVKKQYVKFEALVEKAKHSVLIIDDLDKITGKKLELTKDLMRNCKRYVVTARGEDNINRTIRNIMFKRRMKISTVQLTSKASVDATNILFAIFILGLFVGGLPEAAMLVMAGRLATRGTS